MAPFPSATTTWHSAAYPAISPTRPDLSAKGKSVLITGAGTGIGAETARYFAQAGASRIALLGRRIQPLEHTKASILKISTNIEVLTASTDVAKKEQVDSAFEKFAGSSPIDILVSNAAVAGPFEAVANADPDEFLNAVDINVRGALLVAQAFMRHAAPEAVVIETSSAAAHFNLAPGFASYGVSKMAVVRMFDLLAFANPNLSIFHVQPGVVATDMNKSVGGTKATGFEDDVSLPAGFNVWLASPEARFLKNKFLWANWDVDELKARAKEIESSSELRVDLVGWPFGEPNWKFSLADDAPKVWKG